MSDYWDQVKAIWPATQGAQCLAGPPEVYRVHQYISVELHRVLFCSSHIRPAATTRDPCFVTSAAAKKSEHALLHAPTTIPNAKTMSPVNDGSCAPRAANSDPVCVVPLSQREVSSVACQEESSSGSESPMWEEQPPVTITTRDAAHARLASRLWLSSADDVLESYHRALANPPFGLDSESSLNLSTQSNILDERF
ncbi:hypothetical protein FVE85_8131 [Porphyridium purpureum]|uniref:Uncharacterized protein n=1 Tax=Porphyridium purpureum TaxID=35688 RepID=A0A5J4YPK8_PORPP|nr:hypothetical protein FVE85_8131 [Porphyridium purpureum]|eukprot:POR5583..scf295_9